MYIIQMKYLEKTVILQDVMHIHIYIYSMNKSKEEILQGEVTINYTNVFIQLFCDLISELISIIDNCLIIVKNEVFFI